MGQRAEDKLGSRKFFENGEMMACLKTEGKVPEGKEEMNMWRREGVCHGIGKGGGEIKGDTEGLDKKAVL